MQGAWGVRDMRVLSSIAGNVVDLAFVCMGDAKIDAKPVKMLGCASMEAASYRQVQSAKERVEWKAEQPS